jgi:TATA-box binding protein (TBP) (component of TFIID and TFIIIB)
MTECETCGTCGTCGRIVLCKCYSDYSLFDSVISNNCVGKVDVGSNVNYSTISISTMTICFNFNESINLDQLKEKLSKYKIISYKPGSKKSKIPKKRGTDSFYNSFDIKLGIVDYTRDPKIFSNISIFIFPNGKVKIAGAKTINTIRITIDEISELIGNPNLKAENIKIQMICSDFKIKPITKNPEGWCIKQEILKNILVKNYSLSATFSPLSRYPGINLKINSKIEPGKQVSLLIFRSGSIIITGAKNAKDVADCYLFIVGVISKYSKELFYYDINEEIKNKKLKAKKEY